MEETMETVKQPYHNRKLEDIPTSEKVAKETIKQLKRRKSLGPYEMPNEVKNGQRKMQ